MGETGKGEDSALVRRREELIDEIQAASSAGDESRRARAYDKLETVLRELYYGNEV